MTANQRENSSLAVPHRRTGRSDSLLCKRRHRSGGLAQRLVGMPTEILELGYSYADKKLYDSFEPGDTQKLPTVITRLLLFKRKSDRII